MRTGKSERWKKENKTPCHYHIYGRTQVRLQEAVVAVDDLFQIEIAPLRGL